MSTTPAPIPAGAVQLKLHGKVYDATATFDRLPLRDILLLESQTREFGKPMTWSEMRAMMQRLITKGIEAEAALKVDPHADVETMEGDDDWPWYLAILVWAARRLAGEDITFDEAVDFPMSDLKWHVDEAALRGSSADPHQARPGSGRAGAKAPGDRKRSTKKGSGKGSRTGS